MTDFRGKINNIIPTVPPKGTYPLGNIGVIGDRKRPSNRSAADSTADSIADHPVGMA